MIYVIEAINDGKKYTAESDSQESIDAVKEHWIKAGAYIWKEYTK